MSNEIIPHIEKPAIRIDTGIKLYEIDDHVGNIAAKLDPVNYPEEIKYDPQDLGTPALQELRETYLKVDDISPVFDRTPDNKLSLIYQASKALSLRELDDFLTNVTNKLHTVITLDLKKDVNQSSSLPYTDHENVPDKTF